MGMKPNVAITEPDRPQIWVGCFRCRNDGLLVGTWFDAVGAADITVADVHRGSGVDWAEEGCEEIWGFDLDGCWPINAEMDTVTAAKWAERYEEVGVEQWPAFCAWVRSEGVTDPEDADTQVFTDRYRGEWESFEAYARDYVESVGEQSSWPEEAQRYFDLARYARDLAHGYTVEPSGDGGVYIYSDS